MVAKQSFSVLRNNPSLCIFPILSGVAAILVSIPFVVVLAMTDFKHSDQQHVFGVAHYATTAIMYFCNYFTIVFFNAGLVACANENLQGRPATVQFGMRAALARLPQILGWALLASTVGMVLRFIGERTGVVGSIVTSFIGLAWNIAVFFVVPCLVLDLENPFAAVKKSTVMIKQTWGERIILGIGVGSALGILFLIAMVPIFAAFFFAVSEIFSLAIVFGVIGLASILAVCIISSAITTIYQTALYIYCQSGTTPYAFQASNFQDAFQAKTSRGIFGQKF